MKSENSAVKHNPSIEWWAIFFVFSQVLCEISILQYKLKKIIKQLPRKSKAWWLWKWKCMDVLIFKVSSFTIYCINALIFHVSSFTICYINALVIKASPLYILKQMPHVSICFRFSSLCLWKKKPKFWTIESIVSPHNSVAAMK